MKFKSWWKKGATYADYLFEKLGGIDINFFWRYNELKPFSATHVNRIYRTFNALNIEADAYHQLTTNYMRDHFNKEILNVEGVK